MMRHPWSSDELDPLTAQTLDRMVRDHQWTGDWQRVRERAGRSQRARRRMPLLVSAVAGALLIVLVTVLSVRTDSRTTADHRWSDPVNGISIDVEAPFQRASLALAPASHEILSLSTGPLLIGSPTDRLPTRAVQAIGDRGVLITIDELERPEDLSPTNHATPDIGFQRRPTTFELSERTEADSTVFPEYEPLTSEDPAMRRWTIPFTDHRRRLIAIVVAGDAVTEKQLQQASRLLNSLQVSPRPIVNPIPPAITKDTSTGRVRYVGTVNGHPVYVGIDDDGEVCIQLNGLGVGCSPRAVLDGRGLATMYRSASGNWFGAVVPPTSGTVTANGAPIGEGPQPILVDGVMGDAPVIQQGDVEIPVVP